MGLKVAREFYADRAYHPHGSLVSRAAPGALIEDLEEIENRLSQLFKTGTMTTIEGQQIPVSFESMCVHGDTPHALEIVRIVREACTNQSVAIEPLAKILG